MTLGRFTLRPTRQTLPLQVPVSTSGNYKDVTSIDQIEVNSTDDPLRPGLRIKFKIKKTTEKEPNTNEVSCLQFVP